MTDFFVSGFNGGFEIRDLNCPLIGWKNNSRSIKLKTHQSFQTIQESACIFYSSKRRVFYHKLNYTTIIYVCTLITVIAQVHQNTAFQIMIIAEEIFQLSPTVFQLWYARNVPPDYVGSYPLKWLQIRSHLWYTRDVFYKLTYQSGHYRYERTCTYHGCRAAKSSINDFQYELWRMILCGWLPSDGTLNAGNHVFFIFLLIYLSIFKKHC